MSDELIVALEERFGVRLPVMELSESSSIDKLSVRILSLLRGEAPANESSEPAALAESVLAIHGTHLTHEQVAEVVESAATPNRLIQ